MTGGFDDEAFDEKAEGVDDEAFDEEADDDSNRTVLDFEAVAVDVVAVLVLPIVASRIETPGPLAAILDSSSP